MRLAINSIKEWFFRTLCHSENEGTQEPETIKPEIIMPPVNDDPLMDLEETEVSDVAVRDEDTDAKDITDALLPESEEKNSDHVEFDVVEPVSPLEMLASEKPVNEPKLVALTVDSIKYYDKLRSQMPTDDLKSILDDVCRNLIDNLILSGCAPINEEPGCFDMSRHRVEPFQLVEEGTPYSKVTRKGVVYQNEVKLLAIVEL